VCSSDLKFHFLSFPGAPQKLQCIDDTPTVLALKAQCLAKLGDNHDHNLVEAIITKFPETEIAPCLHAKMQPHPEASE